MNTDRTDYRFECIVNLKFILSVIFSYSGNGLVQCLYYYRLYSVLQWKRSRSVFILLSVIFSVTVETVSFSVYIIIGYIHCYSGNGLVQFSVYIIIGYIQCYSGNGLVQCLYYYRLFSYSGNGLVQCSYYYRLYSVTVETVSFSVYIIIGYIQCYSGNGLVQCLYYYRLFSYSGNGLVQCSVYIIIGYIQCYSGNGLVQGSVGGS